MVKLLLAHLGGRLHRIPLWVSSISRQLEAEAAMNRYLMLKRRRPDFGYGVKGGV